MVDFKKLLEEKKYEERMEKVYAKARQKIAEERYPFIKDGVCHNDGSMPCNLGYACDDCPYNKDNQ